MWPSRFDVLGLNSFLPYMQFLVLVSLMIEKLYANIIAFLSWKRLLQYCGNKDCPIPVQTTFRHHMNGGDNIVFVTSASKRCNITLCISVFIALDNSMSPVYCCRKIVLWFKFYINLFPLPRIKLALVPIMAWSRPGYKSLSELVMGLYMYKSSWMGYLEEINCNKIKLNTDHGINT